MQFRSRNQQFNNARQKITNNDKSLVTYLVYHPAGRPFMKKKPAKKKHKMWALKMPDNSLMNVSPTAWESKRGVFDYKGTRDAYGIKLIKVTVAEGWEDK